MKLATWPSAWTPASVRPIGFVGRNADGRWLYRLQGLIWLGCCGNGYASAFKIPTDLDLSAGRFAPYAIMQWRMQRQLDMGTAPVALALRRHLEEQSGGEVWSWPEMLRVFKS